MTAAATLTRLHRRDLRALTDQSARDLKGLWRIASSAAVSRDRLIVGLIALADEYGPAAAALGADYYDELRDVERVRGSFRASPSGGIAEEALEVLARVAVGSLFGADPDPDAALTLATGGLQRHIANEDRETVRQSSLEDPRARGWMRVGGGGCDFCQMLIGRGEVYTEETATFEAHDHCSCSAAPAFS